MACYHPVYNADELVLEAVVGEKRDRTARC